MSVRSILNEKGCRVITAKPDTTIRDVASLMKDNRIGAVVITDDEDRIAGIFTERDLVACVARTSEHDLRAPVTSVMWPNVHCCTHDTSITTLMDMMSRLRARHLPVERNGRLAGIVSIGDVVRHHIKAIECEAEFIRSYIAG